MKRATIETFVIGLALIGVPLPAMATPLYFASEASTQAVAPDDVGNGIASGFNIATLDSGLLVGVNSASSTSVATGVLSFYNATTAGTGVASVDGGVLHAFASAGSSSDNIFTASQATAVANYNDTVQLVSNTLPDGTPVSLRFSMALTYSLAGGCFEVSGNTAPNGAINASAVVSTGLSGNLGLQSTPQTCNQPVQQDTSLIFSSFIGQELGITASLVASALGNGAGGVADVSNTLVFMLDPLGDFSYITASGHTYFSDASPEPAPEPASLTLLGLGLAGMAARRWRQRKA